MSGKWDGYLPELNATSRRCVMNSMRVVGVWCFVVPCLLLADHTTDGLIAKVEQHYNRARTLTVDFAEDYSVDGHGHPPESGKLTLRKQGKMRWDYVKPAGKVFVSDGKMLYLYTSDDNKVEKIPLRDTEDMRAPLAFLLGHLELKKEFQNFTVRPDGEAFWLDASAKNAKTPYERIQMLIGTDGEIGKLDVIGRDGSRLQFTLSHEQVNPPVNDAFFAFKIPPGAEVVDGIQYAGEGR